jgi:hypothetical protein
MRQIQSKRRYSVGRRRGATCETLEPRQLLATYTYNVPQNLGYTSAYLIPRLTPGEVEVRLNSPTGTLGTTFTGNNGTGMYVIDCGSIAGFVFVDRVPAAFKPTDDGDDDNGIRVQGGSGGTLRIEAGDDDTLIRITESTSTSATIEVDDESDNVANSRFGYGVNKLIIQTSPDTGSGTAIRVATDEPQIIGQPPIPDLPGLSAATDLRIDCLGAGDSVFLGGTENASVDATIHIGTENTTVSLEQNHAFANPPHADGTTSATIDFHANLNGNLGSGSQLLIGNFGNGASCTATLAQAPGTSSHDMVLGTVDMTSFGGEGDPATLIVSDEATIGEIFADDDTVVSIEAPLTVSNASGMSGTFTSDGSTTFTGTSDPSTIYNFNLSDPVPETSAEVSLLAGADVTVRTSSEIGALSIAGTGKLTLEAVNQPASDNLVPRVLVVNSLNLGSSPTGVLDLTDGALIIDYDSSSPSSTIRQWLDSGHDNDGTWDGLGINSSRGSQDRIDYLASEIDYITGLGHSEASDIPGLTSFGGVTVDSTMVLVRYTYYGDADLSGAVDVADLGRLATHWQEEGEWPEGDFNYDDEIDVADLGLIATNWQKGRSNPSSQSFEDAWDEVNG